MRFRRSMAVFVLLGFCVGPVLYGTPRGADWWPGDLAALGNWSVTLPISAPTWPSDPAQSPQSLALSSAAPGLLEANQTSAASTHPNVSSNEAPPPLVAVTSPPSPSPPPALGMTNQSVDVSRPWPATSWPPNISGGIVVPGNHSRQPSATRTASAGLLYLWYFGNLQPHHTNWAPVANFIRWVEAHRPGVQWLWCPNPPRPLDRCGRPPKTEKVLCHPPGPGCRCVVPVLTNHPHKLHGAQDGTTYVFCPNDKIQAAKCAETAVARRARVVLVVKGRAKRGAPPPGQAEFGVLKHLRALNYSRLAVFLTTDELCTFHSSKVGAAEWIFTQYYHHRLEHVDPSKVYYLPTGVASKFPPIHPREHIPAAKRKFVFNLVCSIVTNKVRQKLKLIIEKSITPRFQGLPVFQHYAHTWSGNYDNKSGYLEPQQFKAVLLDSVFTLMPSGHNPECYRMYESMEAGSIPVVAMEGLETHCVQPFIHFRSAPMVFLDTWDQLPALLQNYSADPARYWRQAGAVVRWYAQFQETIYGTMVQLLLS